MFMLVWFISVTSDKTLLYRNVQNQTGYVFSFVWLIEHS